MNNIYSNSMVSFYFTVDFTLFNFNTFNYQIRIKAAYIRMSRVYLLARSYFQQSFYNNKQALELSAYFVHYNALYRLYTALSIINVLI